MDFAQATITWDIFIPGQQTPNFTILQSEFALLSTGSWLRSRLISSWRWAERRTDRIFSNSKYAQKKRESMTALKKYEFTSESGNVDTWHYDNQLLQIHIHIGLH